MLGRESTLIFAFDHVANRLDGRLTAAGVRGSLLGTIHVRELGYRDRFGELVVQDARLEWRPVRLLLGQLAVGAMSANAVTLELAPSEGDDLEPPQSLAAPMSFAVPDSPIDTLRILRADGTQEIRGVRAAFSGNGKHIAGELKALETRYGHARGRIDIGARSPFPLRGDINIAGSTPVGYSVDAELSGSLMDARAAIVAKAQDAKASVELALAPFDAQPLTRLDLSAEGWNPRLWDERAPVARIGATVHIAADAERALTGDIVVTNDEAGAVDAGKLPFARWSSLVQGTPAALALDDIEVDLGQAGQLAGRGAWRDGTLDVRLDTRNLDLRGLQSRLRRTALAGYLALGGNLDAQRVRLDMKQAAVHVRFAGALSNGAAKIEQAYARAGGAEISARGRVTLDGTYAFDVAGQLRRFDPSRFGTYPSHLINGRFAMNGTMKPVIRVAANMSMTDSRLYGLPASARGTFRSQQSDHPDVDVDMTMQLGDTRAAVKGIVKDPGALRAMDMQLTLSGRTLAELYAIVGVPLPGTPPYRIRGRLTHQAQAWELRQFSGVVGDSDLSGNFAIDRGRTPQFIKADLKSNVLDLADLSGFIGAEKTSTGKVTTRNPSRVLPDTPYNLEKLRAANADIRFEGKRIAAERLPVTNMSTHLVLKDGVLTLAPLNFGAAGGTLVSEVTLDARSSVIASRADIRMQGLQLAQLLPRLKVAQASVGEMDARVKLAGRGNSVGAMLGSANGDVALAVGEGSASDLMLRLSNLDLANALLVLMRGDRNIPIRCVVADLAFQNGVMRPRQFVFDTAHTTLVGEGTANFAAETLDMRLVAKPRSNSMLSLRGPIVVSGTFAQPSVMPDMKRLTARGAAAIGLSAIAAPLAAIVPFVQLGRGEDVQCGPLLHATRQKIERPGTRVAHRE